ncbi:iron ABC transporter permease [Arthrobacter sp.]|uniref:FecCD family ABC transporter permease n=1 Tax=Arthrobacter sp. TaxID=1667 RepID=UPI0026E08A83|nr:iron ABC transporter permease [Arthrobacter sp.]MDO5752868.1 iron ABC transporter permease [Arthrobacter sp.]
MSTIHLRPAATAAPRRRRPRPVLGWALGLALLGILCLASIATGSRTIPLSETWQALTAFDPGKSTHLLVVELRLPRTVLAVVVGAALALAGALMQALTRNPLAEPGILGVNAGAAAAVAVGLAFFGATAPQEYMWFGFVGAGAASLVVHTLGRAHDAGNNPVRLVLAGAGLSVMLGSLTAIIIIAGDSTRLRNYVSWASGSLQGRGWDVLLWVLGACIVAAVAGLATARSLDSLSLGNDLGNALGLKMRTTWLVGTATIVLLAGTATAAAGPVGFLGLAAPHMARMIVGPNHRRMLPYSMLIGALLLLVADILGRVIAAPGEIGAGIMSAVIGAPVFIALARRRKLVQL